MHLLYLKHKELKDIWSMEDAIIKSISVLVYNPTTYSLNLLQFTFSYSNSLKVGPATS